MANLEELYMMMKEAEEQSTKIRAELKEAMQLKRKEAPRGYTAIICKKVPKYDTMYGGAKLNHALNGTVMDVEVLKALDEIVPDKPDIEET